MSNEKIGAYSYNCECTQVDCDEGVQGETKNFTVVATSSFSENTGVDISARCLGQRSTAEIIRDEQENPLEPPVVFETFDFRTGLTPQPQEVIDIFESQGMEPPPPFPSNICQLSPQLCQLVDEQFK